MTFTNARRRINPLALKPTEEALDLKAGSAAYLPRPNVTSIPDATLAIKLSSVPASIEVGLWPCKIRLTIARGQSEG